MASPPPRHLLGLPLERAAERARQALQRKHEDDWRRQEEAAREAAERRVGILAARTETVLGAGADAWLGSPGRKSGVTPRQAAEKDDGGLQSVLRALDRIEEQRRRQAEKDRLAADARAELQRAARERFPDGHADVFLSSAHPDLGGQRPLLFCEDPVTLRRCMALLPPRRARRAR
jgi:hypothetical protein